MGELSSSSASSQDVPGRKRSATAPAILTVESGKKLKTVSKKVVIQHQDQEKLGGFQKIWILISAFLNALIALGFVSSEGVLFVEMIDMFNTSRSQASLIQGLSVGITFGAGALAGPATHYLGVRPTSVIGAVLASLALFASWFATSLVFLIITIGVLTGFGTSCLYISMVVTLAKTFPKANHITLPALQFFVGLGSILFPYFMDYLLQEFGLRGTLLIISGIYMNTIPLSLVSSFGTSLGSGNIIRRGNVSFQFLKNFQLVMFIILSIVAFFTMNTFQIVLVDMIVARGFLKNIGLQLLLIYSATNTVARLGSGLIKHLTGLHGAVIFAFGLLMCSTAMLLIRNTTDYTFILVDVIFFGLGYGLWISVYAFTILEFVGQESFSMAIGIASIFNSAATPVGAAVLGILYDRTKTYELSLLIFGISGNCAAVLILIVMSSTKVIRPCRYRVHVINP